MVNWYAGWTMILIAFVTGAVLGLSFVREDFLGGYTSFRRRITRLGHVALAALGMMNVLYGLGVAASDTSFVDRLASAGFLAGGVTMPAVCFLTAWRTGFRHLFFIPVLSLVTAVLLTLYRGVP
jgi:steroid 5-alpha reductase family enzyme